MIDDIPAMIENTIFLDKRTSLASILTRDALRSFLASAFAQRLAAVPTGALRMMEGIEAMASTPHPCRKVYYDDDCGKRKI